MIASAWATQKSKTRTSLLRIFSVVLTSAWTVKWKTVLNTLNSKRNKETNKQTKKNLSGKAGKEDGK